MSLKKHIPQDERNFHIMGIETKGDSLWLKVKTLNIKSLGGMNI